MFDCTCNTQKFFVIEPTQRRWRTSSRWAVNSEIIKQVTSSWSIFIQLSLRVILGSVFTANLRITLICQSALISGHSVYAWQLVIFVSSRRVDERWSIPNTWNSTAPRLVLGPMSPSSKWKTTATFHQHTFMFCFGPYTVWYKNYTTLGRFKIIQKA